MNILLDECVPLPLRRLLHPHKISSVKDEGWTSFKNGALLSLASPKFDLFLTADQSLRYQQNLKGFDIAVAVLSTNNLRRLDQACGLILESLDHAEPEALIFIEIP